MRIAYNPKTSGPLPQAPGNNDITFDLAAKVIYARGTAFDGKAYKTFKKHDYDDDSGGWDGLVPAPSYSTANVRLLREDGQWVHIAGISSPDQELDEESINSVENKVITKKINELIALIGTKAVDVYKNIKVGNTTIVAKGVNDTLEFKLGNGIIITPNATNKSLEFSINATGNQGINTSYSNNQLVVKIQDEYYNKWNAVYNWYISVTEEDTDNLINKWQEIVDFLNSIAEGTDILDEFVTRKTDQTIIGGKTFSKQIISSVEQGTAPFSVASTTVVSKLNADLLDGYNASGLFTNLSNDTNQLSITIGGTNKKLIIDYANAAGRLEGGSIATWGTLTSANGYTNIATYDYGGTKGAFSFAGKGGQLSLQVDGFFYQNEGRFLVLDTNNYSTHLDNRYYTETEINNKLKEYLPLIGGTMTGPLNFANGTWNSVGDDAAIGDYNAAGMLGLKSLNNDIPGVGFHNKSGTLLGRLQAKGNNLYWNDNLIIHGGNNNLGYIGTTAVQSSGAAQALTGINSITFTPLTGTNGRAILYQSMGDNDQFRIYCGATASNGGWVEIATADDGTEPIYVRQYTGTFTTLKRTATLLDASGNTSFPGYVTSTGFIKSGSSSSYALTGDGGHKQWSTSSSANTLVARDANQYIYATYYNSNISNEDSISIGSVYVRNTSDNWIRRMSYSKFIEHIYNSLDSRYVNVVGDIMTGSLRLKGSTSADMTYSGNVHPALCFENSDSSQNIRLIFTDYDSYRSPAGLKLVGNQGGEWLEVAGVTYGPGFYHTSYGSGNYLLTSNGGAWAVHTGRNNEANKIVRTDANGYIQAGWINTTSGDMGTTGITRIYCSDDGYIRYKTPANFFSVLTNSSNQLSITVGDQNRKVTVAYATNAGSATNADTVDNLHASSFYVQGRGTVNAQVDLQTIPKDTSGGWKVTNSGWAGMVAVLGQGHAASNRAIGFLFKGGQSSRVNLLTQVDSTWSDRGVIAYTSDIPTTMAWGSITGKPSTFTPSSHTHDDRYYTESEADSRFVNVSGDTMTGNLRVPSLFINTGDPTLKIYSGKVTDAKSDGNICLQTCIDGADGQTHSYAPNYQARENLVLQPRGGQVYIGTNPDGGNTSYKLYVNGTIYGTSFSGNVAWGNITGKPSFFSGNYNDLTNKPTIPSVGNGTVTIKQAGTTKGSFTMNQSGNTTIELTDNNTTYSFTNNNPTLSWGTKSTIGTVGGVALTVTMPANPNTNTWRSITNSYSGVDTTISLSQKGANDLYKALSGYKSTTASRNTSNTTAGTLQIRQWGPFVNICGRITLKYTNTNTAYVAFTVPSTIGAPVADVGFHITYYGTGSDDDRGCLLYASAGSRTFYFTYNELNNTPSVYINICYFTETSTFTLTKI